jgi:BlaI family penicillinase repressor
MVRAFLWSGTNLGRNPTCFIYEIIVVLRNNRKSLMERLSQPEEDALRALWRTGPGFVKDVLEHLPEPRPPYTTLASTLRNLERKAYASAEKLGNSFRYTPLVSAEDYQRRSLGALVREHFQNSYKELVSFFAKEEKVSAEDLQEIIRLIENQKPE